MLSKNVDIVRAMSSSILFDYLLGFGKGDYKRHRSGRRADAGYGLRGGIELEDAATALSPMADTSNS